MNLDSKATNINNDNAAVNTEVKTDVVSETAKTIVNKEHKVKTSNSLEAKTTYDKKDNRGPRKNFERKTKTGNELNKKVIEIRKINKVTTGGRRQRFSAAVAVGDGKGTVGFGIAKANEVIDAIKKATDAANKNLVTIAITKNNNSILHQVTGKYCSSLILLKPAKEGIGIKAGGSARDILELVGIHNIYSKAFRSRNKINLARATIKGLADIKPASSFIRNADRHVEKKNIVAPKRSNG